MQPAVERLGIGPRDSSGARAPRGSGELPPSTSACGGVNSGRTWRDRTRSTRFRAFAWCHRDGAGSIQNPPSKHHSICGAA
jgi:hypothetical protein